MEISIGIIVYLKAGFVPIFILFDDDSVFEVGIRSQNEQSSDEGAATIFLLKGFPGLYKLIDIIYNLELICICGMLFFRNPI